MTSHWISLILKIFKITKNKIDIKNYIKFSQKNILNAKTLIFKIKKKKELYHFHLICYQIMLLTLISVFIPKKYIFYYHLLKKL